MKRILLALILALTPTIVSAQCTGQAPTLTFCGNNTGALALPGWKALSSIPFPTIAGGTVLGNRGTSSAVASPLTNPILGIPGTSSGQLGFAGSVSGTATIAPQAAAGTPTLTLPNTSGTFAVNATSPLVLSATTGALTCATCGVTTSPLSQFASTTSAQLAGVLSDETGTGVAVFGTGPTLTGVTITTSFTATGLVGLTNLATQATNTVLANVTAGAASPTAYAMSSCIGAANALQWVTNTGFTCAAITAAASSIAVGTTTISSGSDQFILYNNAGVLANKGTTGTGNVVQQTSPTLTGTLTAATISASGTVSAATLQVPDGNSYLWGAGSASIVGNSSANVLAFYTASTERVRISTGVGIGTTTDPGAGALLANTSIASTTYVSVGTKIRAGGSAPTITAGCNGAGSSISGSDLAGTVTGQTAAATTCTITFNSAYASAPYCTPVGVSSPLTGAITTTTTTLQVNFASTANYVFNYNCVARSGG